MAARFLNVRLGTCLLVTALLLAGGLFSVGAPVAHAPTAPRAFATHALSAAVPAAAVRSTPISIPVGEGPDAVAVDTANDTLFVANEYTNNVSEFSLSTNTFLGAVPVGSGPCPGCLALDAANGTVYVANSGSNNVSAVSLSYGGVSANIPVGSFPDAILFNPVNKNIYVANAGSGTLTVINTLTNNVTLTIPVGPDPVALAVDSANGNVLVAVSGSNNLTIVSAVTNLPLAVVNVGFNPDAVAYDPGNNEIYVANAGSDNVSVVGATNHTYDATVYVGSGPSALAVDQAKKEVFVANRFSGNVSVISTVFQAVVANLTVGSQPGTNGAMLYYAKTGAVFVANGGSSNISVLTATPPAVGGAIPVLGQPEAMAMNQSNGLVYVADFGAANVSVFSVTKVTFRAVGLPAGSNWSVAAGAPALVRSNVTYRGSGTLVFFESNGSFPYAIQPPAGFGVSHVVGPRRASQTLANLTTRAAVFRVVFGPLVLVTINETGLPAGANWSVAVSSAFPTGGAPTQSASTNGTSITFSVVKGPWKYTVLTRPSTYRPLHPSGLFRAGAHAVSITLAFRLVALQIVFRETGLPPGTPWTVNITGTVTRQLSGSSSQLSVFLPNGSYTFVVSNFSSFHPATGGTPHDQGSFVVVAPGLPLVERITYSSSP